MLALKKLGFTHHEILNDLTAAQARTYFEMATEQQQESMKQDCVATRIAYHADEKQFDKFMKGTM